MHNKLTIYVLSIFLSCLFTAGLSIIHSTYILHLPVTAISFVIPLVAGILFGCTFAHSKVLSQRLTELAHTDALTHIYNRLYFDKFLGIEASKARRYGGGFSIIFFDIDHFKNINDHYGHPRGDRVLRRISDIVSSSNRDTDIFARYGGEEFILLAPSTNIEGAFTHAERLRSNIENSHFSIDTKITSSFGVTEFDSTTDNAESVIKRADEALYLAKKKGRNRVEKL